MGFQFRPERSRFDVKTFPGSITEVTFLCGHWNSGTNEEIHKNAVDAVTSYLTQVYSHTTETLTRAMANFSWLDES